MSLLIDGYNLLHVSGIIARGVGPGGLERSRLALLNFLAESLEPEELPRTTVVFDAQDAPRGLPQLVIHRGITVQFAAQHAEADDLIEELIGTDSAPRRLVVVSSDHRLQRAARRRRAKAVDSDVWYADLVRNRRARQRASCRNLPARPAVPLLEEDANYWLRQFGGESALMEFLANEAAPSAPRCKPSGDDQREADKDDRGRDKPIPMQGGDLDNLFPPGYGEDLLE
jgi:predicted RNA-binding protein with PIN domain